MGSRFTKRYVFLGLALLAFGICAPKASAANRNRWRVTVRSVPLASARKAVSRPHAQNGPGRALLSKSQIKAIEARYGNRGKSGKAKRGKKGTFTLNNIVRDIADTLSDPVGHAHKHGKRGAKELRRGNVGKALMDFIPIRPVY